MSSSTSRQAVSPFILAISGLLSSVWLAHLIAGHSRSTTIWLLGGVLLVLATFFHTRFAIYLIIFSMLLSPEIGTGVDAGGRPLTIRLEDLILIVVGLSWFARTAYRKELGLLKNNPLNKPIFAYCIAAIIATLVSGLTSEVNWLRASMFLAKYIEYFILYFIVLTNIRTRSDIKNYLKAALVTCAIVSLVGIAQIPTGTRISAPFEGANGEPNTFGGYLVFMLAIVAGFYLSSAAFRSRLAWMAFGSLVFIPLLFTLSRSSWMAALAMVVVLLAFTRRKSHIATAGAIALLFFPLLAPKSVIDRIEYTFGQPEERGQIKVGEWRLDTSSSARIASWRLGLEGWAARPLTGYGVAGYYFMDAQYLTILTETGLLGLAAFGWLAWCIWRTALDRFRTSSDSFSRGLALGFLAGYVAMLVHGIGANTFIIIRIMEPFWLLTALVVALPETEESEAPEAHAMPAVYRRERLA
jgi:O-antigen ligase